jgi:hypothetical protein
MRLHVAARPIAALSRRIICGSRRGRRATLGVSKLKERLVAIRIVLGFLFVFGLATAWCSQLGEGVLLTATSSTNPGMHPTAAKSAAAG